MLRRSTFGILASGAVLFLAGALGLTTTWSLVTGTLLLTAASLLLAVSLEERELEEGPGRGWTPDGGTPGVDLTPLEHAA